MDDSILARVAVQESEACPVASLAVDGEVQAVSHGQQYDGSVPIDITVRDTNQEVPNGDVVFSHGSETVYRVEREAEQGCACEQIQRQGCPVRDVSTDGNSLLVSFIADDLDALRSVVNDLQSREFDVSIRSLCRSGDQGDSKPMVVDAHDLTTRQREVLQTAHEMGYFERPKGANAKEVAGELDIAPATFSEHLAAAQTKLLDAVLGMQK